MSIEGHRGALQHVVWHGRADFEAFRDRRPLLVPDPHRFHVEQLTLAIDGLLLTEWSLSPLAGRLAASDDGCAVLFDRVRAGSVRYSLGGTTSTGDPGSTHLLPCRAPVRFMVPEPTRVLRVVLRTSRSAGPATAARFGRLAPSPLLDAMVVAAERALDGRGDGAAVGDLRGLAAAAFREAAVADEAEDDLRSRILRHVDVHLGDPDLRPQRIAADLGISLRWLHRVFDGGGPPIAAYIRARRCESVARRLRDGQRAVSLAVLAQQHGFGGRDQLARAFRARYGCSPSEYADRLDR